MVQLKGVVTTTDEWMGSHYFRGHFTFDSDHAKPNIRAGFWKECNPSDHLESLADFHARGLWLKSGDLYTNRLGDVKEVLSSATMNTPSHNHDKRYVVKAAAYDTETPEEKEVFEAMTDTTPQQFESLAKDEQDGEGLPPVGELFVVDDFDTVMLCKYSSKYAVIGEMVERQYPEGIEVVIDLMSTPNRKFSKPETQEQREYRERLEAAYHLCVHGLKSINSPTHQSDYKDFINDDIKVKFWLSIVDETGYRKQ